MKYLIKCIYSERNFLSVTRTAHRFAIKVESHCKRRQCSFAYCGDEILCAWDKRDEVE